MNTKPGNAHNPPAPAPGGTCKMTLGRPNNPIDEITNYRETRNFLFEEQMWGSAAAIYNQLQKLINLYVFCCYQTFILAGSPGLQER